MVGIVVVSHSAALAAGVVELARGMAGGARVEAAGGMAEPPGAIGTDAVLVAAAIERADAGDGVLVLMDLGSAVMSAELAVELRAAAGGEVLLCDAPLVEGAIAAAARAAGGSTLEEVAAEARAALSGKARQLGAGGDPLLTDPERPPEEAQGEDLAGELRLVMSNELGLHARPAARVAETAAAFEARVTVADATTGRPPVDARSLSALMTLGARRGHELVVRASGPEAVGVLDALRRLADRDFGDAPAKVVDGAGEAARGAGRQPVAADGGVSGEQRAPRRAPAAGDVLDGIPVAPGIGIGPARVPAPAAAAPAPAPPIPSDPVRELARLDAALDGAAAELADLRAATAARAGDEEAAIFDAQRLLLRDAGLVEPARAAIAARGSGAEEAWREAAEVTARALVALDDAYLRERAADVRDVAERVAALLAGGGGPAARQEGVAVAADVTPAQVAAMDPGQVRGLAVAAGGATSHAAILARALGIPAVMGLGTSVLAIPDGTPLVVDGSAGTLEVDPGPARLAARERERLQVARRAASARSRALAPAVSRDGVTVAVLANLGDASELGRALELGAEGVGLLRTEFLFGDRRAAPEEDEQREAYERIAVTLAGRPLVIRTLDAGADKPLAYLEHEGELNPYLGMRGIRLGIRRPELLRTQLRAIAAVAARHPLSVMLPMVSSLAELRTARAMLAAALEEAGASAVPLGIMVEVPAVALMAARFAAEADFFSIGTNDLVQYAMAAERGHPQVAPLLAGPPPALLELIALVVRAGRDRGRAVAVCGELAGTPEGAALLAGLGVRELSMAPGSIPEVKEALRSIDVHAAARAALAARAAEDGDQVAALGRGLLGGAPPSSGQ